MTIQRTTTIGRSIRRATLILAGLAVIGSAAVSPRAAQATTDPGRVSHVYVDFLGAPSSQQTIMYSTFLASLRAAAGFTRANDGAQQTQDGLPDDSSGVIQASLSVLDDADQRRGVDLWINPANLYVLGYSPWGSNISYRLNDLNMIASVNRPTQTLGFGGNYNALSTAADREDTTMPIWWNDIRASILQLAQSNPYTNRTNTARSLLLLIQMVSEGARFNDIEGVFRAALGRWDGGRNGIADWQHNLERNWTPLSRFYLETVSGSGNATPVNVSGIGTINTVAQVRRYVRILNGNACRCG